MGIPGLWKVACYVNYFSFVMLMIFSRFLLQFHRSGLLQSLQSARAGRHGSTQLVPSSLPLMLGKVLNLYSLLD